VNQLIKELIRPLLEDSQKVTAVYGGGFKPPIKGHFNLVKTALKDLPEIDDFIIYVGGGVRDGITQEQSMAIWGVYQEVLGPKVQIEPSAQPIRDVMRYAKDHPNEKVYFVIGYREGREDDLQDIASRTKGVEEKYPNLEVKVISTPDPEVSGTNARKAASKGDKEKFITFLPDEVPPSEKEEIYNIVDKSILKEHMAHTNTIDIIGKCAQLSNHMIQKGYKIQPLPGLKVIDSDVDNSQDFFGKTAYYDPNEQLIVLYTQGRHPKDIVRSYAHEMIHHIQNLEDRLGNIQTTNTTEDDHLDNIEREAYEEGNIAFRNWTDSLQEGLYDDTKSFDLVKQNPFDIKKLADKGIVFITKPGDGKGGVADPNWEGDASVLTSYNMDKAEPWMKVAVKNLMPQAIPYIQKDQDKLFYNGKYNQILWGIEKKGLNPEDFYLQEGKDPFGLNQYARELAQGLEEVLTEGRYDKFTNELSRLAFELIKDGYDVGRKVVDETFVVGPADEDPDIVSNDFEFDFTIQATYTEDTYTVDGGANAGYDDEGDEITPLLNVRFEIPKDVDWQEVSFDLKDVIRHELEHLTQDGANVRSGKQLGDDSMIRKMIELGLLPKADYFKLAKEVDAMLQGMYFKAKKARKPFLDIINTYLDKQPINPEEKKEIINLWAKRVKALGLPSLESASVKETTYLEDTGVEKKDEKGGEMRGKKFVIFCDMDGVLVDFDEGYKQLTGMSTQHVNAQDKSNFWKAFRQGLVDKDISEESFWTNLDWQPGGKELWDYIAPYKPYVLTAPAVNFDLPDDQRYSQEYNESMKGKLNWVQRLPNMRKVYFAAAKNKPKFARPNHILIDDRKDTIDAWNANGGIGILYQSAQQVIEDLKELGL